MKLKEKGPVSLSRLQKYEGCPWSYYQKYDLKLPEPSGDLGDYGKLIHAVIAEAIACNCAATDDAFADLSVNFASGELASNPRDQKEITELWQRFFDRYTEIKEYTKKALNIWRETNGEPILEQHFTKALPCGVMLQGYIDFHIKGKKLLDWKTGHNYEKYLESPQLALNAWGVDDLDAERSYIFLPFDRPVFKDTYSIRKAVEWANSLCKQIEFAYEIAEDEGPEVGFPKRPGAACSLCGYKEECAQETAEKLGVVIPDTITSPEQALEVAATLMHLETLVNQTEKVLESYCKTNGPFELNGEWFAIYPGKLSKEWDKAGVYNLLKDFTEEQLLKVFSVSSTGVEALIKELPFIESVIKGFLTETRGNPSFKHQKKPPEGVVKPKQKRTA